MVGAESAEKIEVLQSLAVMFGVLCGSVGMSKGSENDACFSRLPEQIPFQGGKLEIKKIKNVSTRVTRAWGEALNPERRRIRNWEVWMNGYGVMVLIQTPKPNKPYLCGVHHFVTPGFLNFQTKKGVL